ncbi:MAG: glycosyltransferase family 4 protein, partial [Betaproteobacteria bacterium]|nr:glycosyltransferase family 4 protein [Betaproteobacteria bacterium]
MPPFLIDITRLIYRRLTNALPTGIDRVGIEYVRHYGAQSRAVLCLGPFSAVLSRADSQGAFRALLAPEAPMTLLAIRLIVTAFLTYWVPHDLKGAFLFNTSHTGLENRYYAWLLRRMGARTIVIVHDLIPITHPEYCRPGEYAAHANRMRCAVAVGAGIVANSAHTLADLQAFCRDKGLACPPAISALLAPGLPAIPAGPRPMAAPYFVIVSTIEPRKNHWMLLHLWRHLVATMGTSAPCLVIIGKRGWECENVVDLLERCIPLRGVVIEKSQCSDAELITYLHHARALLFPSFAEGYGLPVTEALSLGVPVIANELPVFRETTDGVPDYADPLDGNRWETLIRDYTQPDSPLRAAQIERMTQFRLTTWPQHFTQVEALLASLDERAASAVTR